MLPSLRKLSLRPRLSSPPQPMGTGAFLDDPDLQAAADVFARIWSKAADYTGMTPQQKAHRMCQTLDTVRRIRKNFVPPSFYMHYAVLVGIPGAAQWKETIYSGKTSLEVAAMQQLPAEQLEQMQVQLTQEQEKLLLSWCTKVSSPAMAYVSALNALNGAYDPEHPMAIAEAVWLSSLLITMHKVTVLDKFMREIPQFPYDSEDPRQPWTTLDADGRSLAARDWAALVEAMGGADAVLADAQARERDLRGLYTTATRSGNIHAMRLVQQTFARFLTGGFRRGVGRVLYGGQMDQARELIREEEAHVNEEDDNGNARTTAMLKLFRYLAESMARNFNRDPGNTSTPALDIAALAAHPVIDDFDLPQFREDILVGALLGLRTEHDVPYYIAQYYDQDSMDPGELSRLLQILLGVRHPSGGGYANEASLQKLRAVVTTIGAGTVNVATRNTLLGMASGTRVGPLPTDAGHATLYDVDQMEAVLDLFAAPGATAPFAPFERMNVSGAIARCFYGYSDGEEAYEEYRHDWGELVPIFERHTALLPRLLAIYPDANLHARTHEVCANALLHLYNHLASYLSHQGRAVDDVANELMGVFAAAVRTITDAGITLGFIPSNAVSGPLDEGWREVGRIISMVNRHLRNSEGALAQARRRVADAGVDDADDFAFLRAKIDFATRMRMALPLTGLGVTAE